MKLVDVSKIRNKKILIVAAHSDDVEFLAGGTVLQLGQAELENEIVLVIATDSGMGVHEFDVNRGELVAKRMSEACEAANKWGAKEVKFWNYADMGLIDRKRHLKKRVVKTLLSERADILVTFDPWGRYGAYVHPDHRALGMVVMEAVMLATLPVWVIKNGLGRRMLKKKPEMWLWRPAEADSVVDVSGRWLERMDLLRSFGSQFDDHMSWEVMEQKVAGQAREIGELVGVEYGESFRIME